MRAPETKSRAFRTGLASIPFTDRWINACATLPAMLDIRLIRDQPDFVKSRLATRGGDDQLKIDEVLAVDAERRKLETALQQCNADRKRLSKEIGGARGRGERLRRAGESGSTDRRRERPSSSGKQPMLEERQREFAY